MSVVFVGEASFEGRTLVLPCASFGNVGQMAVDLVVSTALKDAPGSVRVGHLQSRDALPCAGNDAFTLDAPGTLTTSLEVYNVDLAGCPATLLQLRAPAAKGRAENFAAGVAAWAQSAGFAGVCLATGANAAFRNDTQLEGPQVRLVANAPADAGGLAAKAAETGIPALELPPADFLHRDLAPIPDGEGGYIPAAGGATAPTDDKLPTAVVEEARKFSAVSGTGYAPRFFRRLSAAGVPTVAVLMFVHEGDNRPEATGMASALAAVVGTPDGSKPWVPPSSWGTVFGGEPDDTMFA